MVLQFFSTQNFNVDPSIGTLLWAEGGDLTSMKSIASSFMSLEHGCSKYYDRMPNL